MFLVHWDAVALTIVLWNIDSEVFFHWHFWRRQPAAIALSWKNIWSLEERFWILLEWSLGRVIDCICLRLLSESSISLGWCWAFMFSRYRMYVPSTIFLGISFSIFFASFYCWRACWSLSCFFLSWAWQPALHSPHSLYSGSVGKVGRFVYVPYLLPFLAVCTTTNFSRRAKYSPDWNCRE